MNRIPQFPGIAILALVLVLTGCKDSGPEAPETRPFQITDHDIALAWVLTRDHELACEAPEMAGGAITGEATFGAIGPFVLEMSVAWDIGARIADPGAAEFEPEGPAGGPFAPVLGETGHPYEFQANPFTGECGAVVSATGELELTAEDGDRIFGVVTGGETHRLDFVAEGDGIENFTIVRVDGGTGTFHGASGSFVVHVITHFSFSEGSFVIDLVEILPGGEIRY